MRGKTSSRSPNFRAMIADEFIKCLSEEKIPWKRMWQMKQPYNATTARPYRGLNTVWLSYVSEQKGYTDPRWCTFKQAEKKGWRVKNGEKGTCIEFWSLYDRKFKKTVSFEEFRSITETCPERKSDITFLSHKSSVFNAEQVWNIPELDLQNTTFDVSFISGQRNTLIRNMGVTFHEGGDRAYYSPLNDSITMPQVTAFLNDYAYISTLLHEAGHATGHQSRLNRNLTGSFGTKSYALEELRVEIASAFLSQALGIKGMDFAMENHKAYVQSWAEIISKSHKELFAAIKDAEKISDYLIKMGELPNNHPHT